MTNTIGKGFEVPSSDILAFNAGLAIVFILIWPGLYFVLRKHILKDHSAEYTRRCLSVFHWFVSAIICIVLYCEHLNSKLTVNKLYAALQNEHAFGLLFTESMEIKFEDLAIMNALVFILFELFYNLYYKTETSLMMVNHSVLLITAVLCIFRNTMRMFFIEGYTLISVTEPLLHLRWFFIHYDKSVTVPETMFISSFLIIRVGVLSYVGHKYITDENVDNVDKTLLLANYTTGLLFSIHIVQYLQRKYEGKETGDILRGIGANPAPEQVVLTNNL